MPIVTSTHVDLRGIVLPDAGTTHERDLGALDGVWILTMIRHRF